MTPAALVAEVVAVRAVGAGAVHLHVKNADGIDTFGAAELAAVLSPLREAASGLPIGVTTGAWALPDPRARVAAIQAWRVLPDFASVNWHEDGAEEVAAALLDRGIGVEAGLWHAGAVDAWQASRYRHRCLRVLLELPDGLDAARTRDEVRRLLDQLRSGAADAEVELPVLLHGEGSSCWPALHEAVRRGLATRIGLEDTLELPDGSPAPDNAALVVAARNIMGTTTTSSLRAGS